MAVRRTTLTVVEARTGTDDKREALRFIVKPPLLQGLKGAFSILIGVQSADEQSE